MDNGNEETVTLCLYSNVMDIQECAIAVVMWMLHTAMTCWSRVNGLRRKGKSTDSRDIYEQFEKEMIKTVNTNS